MKRLLFAIIQLAQQLLARMDRRERERDEKERQRERGEANKNPGEWFDNHFNHGVHRRESDAAETDKAKSDGRDD